jgi:hypothetical protein
MIAKDDVLRVSVAPEMIESGIAYAERSLHFTFNRMGLSSHYNRIRNIVAGIVMEEAFRSLLDSRGVRYDLMGRTHFTQKDRYDVGIDGHRYDVKGYVLKDEARVRAAREDTEWFLDCSALVPADQVAARSLREADVYVFPFAILETTPPSGARRQYWIHSFWEYEWFKNREWSSLGKMRLTSRMALPCRVRVGGQAEDEELLCEKLELRPGESEATEAEYFTALFLQPEERPAASIEVACEKRDTRATVAREAWENVWVEVDQVFFAGWMSKGEFRERSTQTPRFYKECKQYDETKTENRMLLVKNLRPMSDLLG